MTDALERVREFINEPLTIGSGAIPTAADWARHDKACLCVSRADLRAIYAEVERLRADADRMRVALESIADSLEGHPADTATEADMDEWHRLAERGLTEEAAHE